MDRRGRLSRIARSWNLVVIAAAMAVLSLPATGTAGVFYKVTPIAGDNSFGFGINNLGDVVGSEFDASGHTRSYLYSNGILTYLPSLGGTSNQGRAINDSGAIAGLTSNLSGSFRAFLYQNGVMRTINVESYAFGINNSADVVGYAQTSSGESHAFLYNNSTNQVKDLGTLGGDYSIALGINDAGLVVGSSRTTAPQVFRAFLYEGGVMKDLGALGGEGSNAQAINNLGQIVGTAGTASGDSHAFLYENGAMKDLGTLGGNYSIATAINGVGQAVGNSYINTSYDMHGFLYNGGSIIDLNTLIDPASGWTITGATGINDSGMIIARAYQQGSEMFPQRALLLTPVSVPEPSGLILIGTGMGCLALAARRSIAARSPGTGTSSAPRRA